MGDFFPIMCPSHNDLKLYFSLFDPSSQENPKILVCSDCEKKMCEHLRPFSFFGQKLDEISVSFLGVI